MNTESKLYSGLAVITGASSGPGYELAKKFGSKGFDLLVVAEDAGIIEAALNFEQLGVNVMYSRIDLASEDGVEKFYRAIKATGRGVDVLCLNAGAGVGETSFDKTDLDEEINLIKLNILSVVHLTKLVSKDMLAVGQGKILFTSSAVTSMPDSSESVYLASKAFVQSFAEALNEENKSKGITIVCLQPGPKEFKGRVAKKDDPVVVAEEAYNALMNNEENYLLGLSSDPQANFSRVSAKTHKEMNRPNFEADI